MNCREMSGVLPGLAEREGLPRVALEAARHLATCGACAESLMRLRSLNGLLDDLPKTEVPATFARRVMRALPAHKWKVGGGLVLALFLSLAGTAATLGIPGASLPSFLTDPIEAASAALTMVVRAALDLGMILRDASPFATDAARLPGPALPAFMSIAALGLLAAFALAASGAAFGTGALRLRHERRRRS